MSRRTRIMVVAIIAGLALSGVAAAGSRAPRGAWVPVEGFDTPTFRSVDDACWYRGELYIVAWADHQPDLYVWRDGSWRLERTLGGHVRWRMAADDRTLFVVTGGVVHRLQDGSWTRRVRGFRGAVMHAALFRGALIVAGDLTPGESDVRQGVLAWNGHVWRPLAGRPGGVPVPVINRLLVAEDELWVAGRFSKIGDLAFSNVARWDGERWHDAGGGVNGEVASLCRFGDGVVAAGSFSRAGLSNCDGLARWAEGRWDPLPALPPEIGRHGDSFRDRCPLPRIETIERRRDNLVVAGSFTFVAGSGDTVHSIAMLSGGVWQRVPGADRMFLSEFQNFDHDRLRARQTKSSLDLDLDVEPLRRRWKPFRVTKMVGDGERFGLIVSPGPERDALLLLGDDGLRLISKAEEYVLEDLGLTTWRDRLVCFGPPTIAARSVSGLAWLTDSGWHPVGDWLGATGTSGGPVHAVTTWHGDLVVAGLFEVVADQAMRRVARYDGTTWKPLGEGIPAPGFRSPMTMLPRSRDLIVIGTEINFDLRRLPASPWRWDGDQWSRIEAPGPLMGGADGWLVAAHGDTVWAVTDRRFEDPAPFHAFVDDRVMNEWLARWDGREPFKLHALVDTTWTTLGSWTSDRWPVSLAWWRGSLHAEFYLDGGRTSMIMAWKNGRWVDSIGHRIVPGEFVRPARFVADGRLLIPVEQASWIWQDGVWSVWPGAGVLSWQERSMYRHSRNRSQRLEVWQGPPPLPDPRLEFPQATVVPTRPRAELAVTGLPELATFAADPGAHGWTLFDPGGTQPPPEVAPRWPRGIELAGHGWLTYRFPATHSAWYRLVGNDVSPPGESLAHVEFAITDTRGRYNAESRSPRTGTDRLGSGMLLPAPVAGSVGTVVFRNLEGSTLRIDDLVVESRPDLFVEALDSLRAQLHRRWRPHRSGTAAMLRVLPPDVEQAARTIVSVQAADSLTLAMVADLDDPRIYLDHPPQMAPATVSSKIAALLEAGPIPGGRPERYVAPRSILECEPLPRGIEAWLEGDIAYQKMSFRRHSMGVARLAHLESARAMVVDLREPDPARFLQWTGRWVLDQLQRIGVGGMCWGRRRDRDGATSDMLMVDGGDMSLEIPIIVFVGPDTDGAHALLAEALSRLAHVTVIGEPTAPLPAALGSFEVPWADWTMMIPVGAWEDPDGRVLTDTRLEPQIVWPAHDTEGLVVQARRVLEPGVREEVDPQVN